MKYSFHPEALKEYLSAVSYYFGISPRLAESFIKAVETGIENILTYPEAWQIVEEDIRRHLIKRFPFGIYYCIEGDSISIYAVMHMSRHPDYWKSRVDVAPKK
jgi:plasmid stabilization system protein ParE